MASSVIHMCIAKKINERLKFPENALLLGSIAPDISKHIGDTKLKSHFLTDGKHIDIDRFLLKYQYQLKNPFIMGYFIHLYTDLLWDKYFISDIVDQSTITLLDGTKIEKNPDLYQKLIYNDYTNLNIKLLDEYGLDLSLFYETIKIPQVVMDEIPVSKLYLLVNHTGIIIQNTKEKKAYIFNLGHIKPFIKISTDLIYSVIKDKL